MRKSRLACYLAILAILLSGCASTQPERVYVDLNQAIVAEPAPELSGTPLPQPRPAAAAVSVKQQGLPATNTTDRTLDRLQMARRLIAENRGKSIASLSVMLKRIYSAQASDEIEKRRRDAQPEHAIILSAALERLRQVFEEYGIQRGPLLAQVNVLARNTDLADQMIAADADAITKYNLTEANRVRAQIRELDAKYNQEAQVLMAEAQKEIDAQIALLQSQAAALHAAAESKAVREAEDKATHTQTELNVRLKQLVPERLPAVPTRQVVVPGSSPLPPPPSDTAKPIFGSLEERRHLLDQEVEIWIKTTGRVPLVNPSRGAQRHG